MASKIHTDNPKHHKYVTVNKKERKKEIKKIIFNPIRKLYDVFVLVRDKLISYSFYNNKVIIISRRVPNYHSHYRYNKYTEHYEHIGQKGCKIVYDDCNHKTYRVIKNDKFIMRYHYSLVPKIFKRKC